MEIEQVKRIAKSRKVFAKPGKYNVKVLNSTPFQPEDADQPMRYIVNVSAMTLVKQLALRRELKGLTGDVDPTILNNNLSFNEFDAQNVPAKGTRVTVHVDYVKNREGENVLAIVASEPIPFTAEVAANWDFEEDEAEVEQSADVTAGVN